MDTKVEIVTQYLSDMHVLEKHIQEALEKQVATTKDQPDINRAIQGYLATTKTHVQRLEQRMEQLGNQDSVVDKAKEAVTNLFGQAAGAIDAVRTHRTSKDLRDDYTAGSLATISYVMLKTTALACDDRQTAQLAETHMQEMVRMLQWIARTIPEVVVRDLEAEREVQLNSAAARQVTNDPQLAMLYGSQAGQNVTA
jgi:ferritin-like metal-binding protein YciE